MVHADARRIPLADGAVQCCVTSPPYWGLRKYAGEQELTWSAWRGAYGLEPTIEMYVAHTVEILREVRRVLRADGVCFWNIGDSYAASGMGGNPAESKHRKQATNTGSLIRGHKAPHGLKPKDLCLIPSRVALAAQADGWWVRSMIVWAKPNPMPESVTDRPTDAYEHIIMLTKSERYYWDAVAVAEDSNPSSVRKSALRGEKNLLQVGSQFSDKSFVNGYSEKRNLRNVWTFATQPYSGAHFATFPEELPRRCILAATSTRGACIQCGAPWQRVTAKPERAVGNEYSGKNAAHADEQSPGRRMLLNLKSSREAGFGDSFAPAQTIGWKPTCLCKGQRGRTQPCVVLDPFGGSGTTGRVALELRRKAILLDLAYGADYAPLAAKRTRNVQLEAFA